jgi:DNA-binding NarL/FixJ family response regulator
MVQPSSVDEPPLVARDDELNHVVSALREVGSGGRRVLLLSGEPGIGKTRLAREAAASLREAGTNVLLGRCFEQYTAVPFLPFTELLSAALASAPAALQAEAPQRWPELVFMIPEFVPARPQQLEGPEAQIRMFRAATGFLHALADVNAIVLLLDDLHWADATSLGLLLFLARHLELMPVRILGTYRDVEVGRQHPLDATLRELLREHQVEEVHLHRLPLDATAALVRTRLRVATASDELVRLVHSRAEGNAFFTDELIKALLEQGAVAVEHEHAALTKVKELDVPRSIRSVIDGRMGRLPLEAQELLRLASLLGQEFDLEVLLKASGQSELEVLAGLDAALKAGVIEERGISGERFAFAHVLIQQTLYGELPAHRRRRRHLRIGAALEQLAPAGSALGAQMARHFLLGGDVERAAKYAMAAGDQASRRYAHAEGAHQYQVAVDLLLDELGDTARGAQVQYKLGCELYDLNRQSEARDAYQAALSSFERLGDVQGPALAHWGIGRVHLGRYDVASAEPHLDSALRLWPARREDAELVRLIWDVTRARAIGGRKAESTELAERNLALAEQLGDTGLVGLVLSGLSEVRTRNRTDLAPMFERAIDLASQAGDWKTVSRLYIQRGTNRYLLGDLKGDIASRRAAIEAARRSGEIEREVFANLTLALSLLQTGAWEEGRATIRTGLTLDPRQDHPYGDLARGQLAWMQGQPEDAARYFERFSEDAAHKRDSQGVVVSGSLLVSLRLQLDRPEDAESAARETLAELKGHRPVFVGLAAGPVAETLIRLATGDAERVLIEIEQVVAESGCERAHPQLLRARALLLSRQHDIQGALQALGQSAVLARSQHAVLELAHTLRLLASLARQQGDADAARQADAERAAIVERIGPEALAMVWAQGPPGAPLPQAADDGPLTPREREVAALIVGGLSNRQIAESLVISERTVENHVSNILARLDVDTRAQVAVWATQHGLGASTPAR